MNKAESEVTVCIDGKVLNNPEFVNKYNNVRIFRVQIEVKRLSGVVDRFYVSYPSSLEVIIKKGDFIKIHGDIRTLNSGDTDFVLEGYIYAKSIKILNTEPENYENDCIIKNAYIVDFQGVRKSINDDSKLVATYRIRLDRKHKRSSYFKVSSWGHDAVTLGNMQGVDCIDMKCRLQSYVSKHSGYLYLCLTTYTLDITK